MVKQDHKTGQLDKAKIVFNVSLPTGRHATAAEQPRKEPFNLPASTIAAQLSSILRSGLGSVSAVGSNQFDASFGQSSVQWIAIVGAIGEKASRRSARKSGRKRRFNQRRFVRGSARHVDGERKTMPICDCHDLGSFSPLGLPDSRSPFFAGAKVASIAPSERSSPPRWIRSSASALSRRAHNPDRFHAWKRRWHVAGEGYRSGRSRHRAPVFMTQRMPSMTRRSSMRGRPRPVEGGEGSSGARAAHCASVSFMIGQIESPNRNAFCNFDF